ncbi:hypothetical protein OIU92_17520 [Escherichia coli]|nr:hypothetical protein [Escherichia coli]
MRGEFYQQLTNDLETARAEGLFKEERIITSAQQADITVADGSHVINFVPITISDWRIIRI